MPLIPALGRKRQEDLCEFEVSLVYRVSSRTGSKATQRNPARGGGGGRKILTRQITCSLNSCKL